MRTTTIARLTGGGALAIALLAGALLGIRGGSALRAVPQTQASRTAAAPAYPPGPTIATPTPGPALAGIIQG